MTEPTVAADAADYIEPDQPAPPLEIQSTVYKILLAISFCHLLNDLMQSLLPAIYPLLKSNLGLDFRQIGLVTLTNQFTAALLQPVIGSYTDKHPKPYSLAIGMGFTLLGLVLIAFANSFIVLLCAAALVGMGSSVFHPESSRIARMASGGQHGLAQSVFQVGGNFGASIGPLLAAFIVIPYGQHSVSWFSVAAVLAIGVLMYVGRWYAQVGLANLRKQGAVEHAHATLSSRQVKIALGILVALIFSKYFYLASLTSYYTFYLIEKFGVSVQSAQLHLFVLLGSVAAGTVIGGPVGDRIGRKYVIWGSIVGALPFTMMLPYANLFWTGVLTVVIGVIIASAFSAILVYAQELVPGKIGMISGLFFGLAFGMGGIGAAVLGWLADLTSIEFVYHICAFLPVIGLLTVFLPDVEGERKRRG